MVAAEVGEGETMSPSELAIVAALVFAWGTVSARLERLDVTAPITFVAAGLLLTHGPLAVLGFTPPPELVKALAESHPGARAVHRRVARRAARPADGHGDVPSPAPVGLPLTIGLGTLLTIPLFGRRRSGSPCSSGRRWRRRTPRWAPR